MAAKMRHCWFCGVEIGLIEERYYDPIIDTCGTPECERESRMALLDERPLPETDKLRAAADQLGNIAELAQRAIGIQGREREAAIAELRKAASRFASDWSGQP